MAVHLWSIRSTEGGSSGLEFALARLGAADRVLAHALPTTISVEVRTEDGRVVAHTDRLKGDADTPMARLEINGDGVERKQIWPAPADVGTPVILPGGEVGILKSWWNADDFSAWRWTLELENCH